MKIQVTDLDGKSEGIDWEPGQLLMELLRDNNLVLASCGGHCLCGTCQIWIDSESFSKLARPSEDELAQLRQSRSFREDASRLACQIGFSEKFDGMRVAVAPYE